MSTAEETRKGDAASAFPTTGSVAEATPVETSPETPKATGKATPAVRSEGVPMGRFLAWTALPLTVAGLVVAWMVSPIALVAAAGVAASAGVATVAMRRRSRTRRPGVRSGHAVATSRTASGRPTGRTTARPSVASRVRALPKLLTAKGRAAHRAAKAGRRGGGNHGNYSGSKGKGRGRGSSRPATSGKRGLARKAASARSFLRNPKAHMAAKRAAKRGARATAGHGSTGTAGGRRSTGRRGSTKASTFRGKRARVTGSNRGLARKARSAAVSRGVSGRVSRGVSRLADRRTARTARKAAGAVRRGVQASTAKPRPMGKRAHRASLARRGKVTRGWLRTANTIGQVVRKAEPRRYVEALAKPLARPEPKPAKAAAPVAEPKPAPRNNGRVTWGNRTVKATPPPFTSPARTNALVPPSTTGVTGGNRMSYVHMIDTSTTETRAKTCGIAADAARRDAAAMEEKAAEHRSEAAGMDDKPGMAEAMERLLDEARRLEDDAEGRLRMAAFYQGKASEAEQELGRVAS